MHPMRQLRSRLFRSALILAAAMVSTLIFAAGQRSVAQTYHVLYTFSGGAGGAAPTSGLTMDAEGNFYGTTSAGGTHNLGMVYKLTNKNSAWVLTALYSFQGIPDGASPNARVIFGPDGMLYGTTPSGGTGTFGGYGTLYRLSPPATFCRSVVCPWNERVLHSFQNGPTDGGTPESEVVFDANGNLYGTTVAGGSGGGGAAYEVTPAGVESVIYSFGGGIDGVQPYAPLTLDPAGNLYGALSEHPRFGFIFELLHSGAIWTELGLFNFYSQDVGSEPLGGLVLDPQGNLYGTASDDGPNGGGVIFELQKGPFHPTYIDLYDPPWTDGGPTATLIRDSEGNLYGTSGLLPPGVVFKMSPSGGAWTYSVLYRFTGDSDGSKPTGPLVMDAHGNLYGTTTYGGNMSGCSGGCGVVFEITP